MKGSGDTKHGVSLQAKSDHTLSTVALLAGLAGAGSVTADTRQQLLRCDDTNLEDGPYGQYYGMDFYGTDEICGGDTLDKGAIGVVANRFIRVRLDNANTDPFRAARPRQIPRPETKRAFH